ncbi:MAG: dimethyl sulfone monooxygenase SfnG [Pseudomonadota bacterium]
MNAKVEPIKFAYWVPNVSGGLVISSVEQRTSWTPEYNRKLAQIAEASGFDYALSQIRFTAGYGADNQHESLSFTHDLLAHTETLKVIAAVLPGPWNPALLSKQIATITHLVGPRVAVNIVSGWFRGEFTAIGEPWYDHDERYRRSEEFINTLRGIWSEDAFTFKGDFYRFHDYAQKPKPVGALPEIFQGGSSRAARDMAARVSDWYFTNGNTPDGLKVQVDDIRGKELAFGRKGPRAKIGINAFGIVRATEAEAKAELQNVLDHAIPDAVRGFHHEVQNAGNASPEREGNWAKSTFQDLVQYNDGFRSNLIGTPEQVAERVLGLKDAGADLILLGFLHFQEEVEFFGKHVIPLVRELEAERNRTAVAAE